MFPQDPHFEVIPSVEERIIFSQTESEHQEKLHQAVNSLSPRQREAIFLLFYQDLTYSQIADLLAIEVKTARNLVGKAIQTLRKRLTFIFFLGVVAFLDYLI